jgi:hypothetical protein
VEAADDDDVDELGFDDDLAVLFLLGERAESNNPAIFCPLSWIEGGIATEIGMKRSPDLLMYFFPPRPSDNQF